MSFEKTFTPEEKINGKKQLAEIRKALVENRPAKLLNEGDLPVEVVSGLPNKPPLSKDGESSLKKYAKEAKTHASISSKALEEKDSKKD